MRTPAATWRSRRPTWTPWPRRASSWTVSMRLPGALRVGARCKREGWMPWTARCRITFGTGILGMSWVFKLRTYVNDVWWFNKWFSLKVKLVEIRLLKLALDMVGMWVTEPLSLIKDHFFPTRHNKKTTEDKDATYVDKEGNLRVMPYVGGIQPGELTMGKRFSELGYKTHLNGKWGIGGGAFLNTPMLVLTFVLFFGRSSPTFQLICLF